MQDVLIIGASGGIGRAIAERLERSGAHVTALSRRQTGFDITDPACVAQGLQGLGPFDAVLVASGALEVNGTEPEKSIKSIDAQAMAAQFAVNAIGPALVLKQAAQLLPKDRRSVFAVLSARVGSIGDNRLGGWVSYRASKAAVNQIVHTSAIELARTHRQSICVALHPGTVATPFTEKYLGRHPSVAPEHAAGNLLNVINDLTPDKTGGFYDYSGAEVPW
ncbi:MAG: SDR family NAD(P)-dependent oxidoreductase [Paracoccaceae bacterium]